MKEITNQYMKSIDQERNAGLKRPYMFKDYHAMQYLHDSPLKWLGGVPPAPIPEIIVPSGPVYDPFAPGLKFFLGYEGTRSDTVQGISPVFSAGEANFSLDTTVYYEGASSARITGGATETTLYYYNIQNITTDSFTVVAHMRFKNMNDAHILFQGSYEGGAPYEDFTVHLTNSGTKLIIGANSAGTGGVYYEAAATSETWYEIRWDYSIDTITVKLDGITVGSSVMPVTMTLPLRIVMAGFGGYGDMRLWFDSISIINNQKE